MLLSLLFNEDFLISEIMMDMPINTKHCQMKSEADMGLLSEKLVFVWECIVL